MTTSERAPIQINPNNAVRVGYLNPVSARGSGELMSARFWMTVRSAKGGSVIVATQVRVFAPPSELAFIPSSYQWSDSDAARSSRLVGVGDFVLQSCSRYPQRVVTNAQRCDARSRTKNQNS